MSSKPKTYAEQLIDWLVEEGYSHCFFLAGGNIMHILNAARTRLTCIPVVHEVSAGIAAEYFNATRQLRSGKAFALVTAGPGVTNILTAMAGAFLESRELLVIAGQVKSTDLAHKPLRQRGIQEVDGIALAAPLVGASVRIEAPISRGTLRSVLSRGMAGRPSPVFVEFCLDAQAALPVVECEVLDVSGPSMPVAHQEQLDAVVAELNKSSRPLVLLGGGVPRDAALQMVSRLRQLGIPVATSWNALDRIDSRDTVYFGRPDTWGMRWSNVLMQQSDLIIAIGARLSLQQTGFNWQAFAPIAKVAHIDIDLAELEKGHPHVEFPIHADAVDFMTRLLTSVQTKPEWALWREFGMRVRSTLPLEDPGNKTAPGFVSPYRFARWLSEHMTERDILVPCSSGGASTVLMQAFEQKLGQRVLNNKALASMGYGLAGAIGASVANPGRRVFHVEGDGGFAQNLQELGTVAARSLNLKTFIFSNNGYASIRMTQRNYFDGAWVGCDAQTGVGFPDWVKLFDSYGIRCRTITAGDFSALSSDSWIKDPFPAAFIVSVDPEQTYFPKIASRVTASGGMESNPIHLMSPELPDEVADIVMPYLPKRADGGAR